MMDLLRLFPFPISYLAKILPPLDPPRYRALVASISQHGLRRPIVVWRGEIIDGVHRLMACLELGIQPRFHHLPDDADPLEFLMAEGFPFRDMDDNQGAVAAHKLSQLSTRGRPTAAGENSANLPIITRKEAADRFGVSVRSVSTAGQSAVGGQPRQRQHCVRR